MNEFSYEVTDEIVMRELTTIELKTVNGGSDTTTGTVKGSLVYFDLD